MRIISSVIPGAFSPTTAFKTAHYSVELIEAVLRLREEYPRWGKDKLVVVLHREGFNCSAASGFIGVLLERMPFPIKAIQVNGGSEFQDAFEEECQRRGIKLFVLPPRLPKLNSHVERAQRTHTEEFYEVTDASFELPELNKTLLKWEEVYNTIRHHQALGYLTPLEFLEQYQQKEGRSCVTNHMNEYNQLSGASLYDIIGYLIFTEGGWELRENLNKYWIWKRCGCVITS
ncbi:MAG: integrase core domain-containing protein [Dehalococcoidales bacterium]|nr:integrase core domain-containing protein [Dehalococcoidales bacterium]